MTKPRSVFPVSVVLLPSDITNAQTTALLDKAEEYGKPVPIGEATPTSVEADDAGDWDVWFGPFFNLIHTRVGIGDSDVGQNDFGVFQGCVSGLNVAR